MQVAKLSVQRSSDSRDGNDVQEGSFSSSFSQYDALLIPRRFSQSTLTGETVGSGSLGFSVSTSVTTVNGVTACLTEFHVGKGTAWTAEETAMLEARFVALASDGEMVG